MLKMNNCVKIRYLMCPLNHINIWNKYLESHRKGLAKKCSWDFSTGISFEDSYLFLCVQCSVLYLLFTAVRSMGCYHLSGPSFFLLLYWQQILLIATLKWSCTPQISKIFSCYLPHCPSSSISAIISVFYSSVDIIHGTMKVSLLISYPCFHVN